MHPLIPPYAHHLNHTMQTVATVALWAGGVLLVAYAARMARAQRSWIPLALVIAVATGSLVEPLYDTSYHLLWYVPGQWTLFTAFGLPQPVWVMPAYMLVFGLPALLLYRRLAAGEPPRVIVRFAVTLAITTAVFEIAAINLNLYGYYGSAPIRVAHYPLWIAGMEACQISGYGVLAAVLARFATRPRHSLALFLLFPANFVFVTLGAGFPVLMTINSPDPSTAAMWIAAVISLLLGVGALVLTARLLWLRPYPAEGRAEATVTPSSADTRTTDGLIAAQSA